MTWTTLPRPTSRILTKCVCHGKRRMCVECECCCEYVCEEGGQLLDKSNPPVPVCDACREEGAEYARYGIWGPP